MSYTVCNVIERIRFNTATENDLIGKSANEIFSNKNIVATLKFALDDYAKTTKALQAIYSLPVESDIAVISAPPYILRSEGIRFFVWFIPLPHPLHRHARGRGAHHAARHTPAARFHPLTSSPPTPNILTL